MQRSGIDTIKYLSWSRTSFEKATITHSRKHHLPRVQPFPSLQGTDFTSLNQNCHRDLNPHSTGRRFRYAHGDLGFSLKLFQIAAGAYTTTRVGQYASRTLLLRCCYDPTTTMKIWLRLVYADGDIAATLLRPWRWS